MPLSSRMSRRQALSTFANGFGMLGLAGLLAAEARADGGDSQPSGGRSCRCTPPRAKRVIFLFMPGGPSHVDLFDPKPRLAADNGKPLPFAKPKLERTKTGNLLASPWKFSKHGQSRHRGQRAVPARRVVRRRPLRHPLDGRRQHQPHRRLPADEHRRAGVLAGRAWARGCSTAWAPRTRTCPASSSSARPQPAQGRRSGRRASCPAAYQGTLVSRPEEPDRQPAQPRGSTCDRQRDQLDALQQLNELHQREPRRATAGSTPASRRSSWPSACRREAPEAFDVDARDRRRRRRSTASTTPTTDIFGRQCLLARRLVGARRAVRAGLSHADREAIELPALGPARRPARRTCRTTAPATDQPIAGAADRPEGAAACSTTRWSSGAASSAARRPPRAPTAASTTRSASRCGWPAAASRAAWPTARPTSSAGTPSRTRSTSTTCTPRSCT